MVSLLMTPAAAMAATDNVLVSGYVELGLRAVSENDDVSAKFQEYRDVDDGIYGNLLFNAYKSNYYLELEGVNIGLEDQSYLLKGGNYRTLKYSVFYDEIPHNLSFGARTPHVTVGSNNLVTSGGTIPASNLWTTFDYATKKKKYGLDLEMDLNSPFYIKVGAHQKTNKGLKPLGSGEFGPTFGNMELPEPVDYTTNEAEATAGYRTKKFLASVKANWSSFDNDNQFLLWENRAALTQDNGLWPDNDYWKVDADAVWKKLPYRSTLGIKAGYSNLQTDYSLAETGIAAAAAPAGLNRTDFNGDISYTTFSAALSAMPGPALDTRIFYNYLDKENDSDVISYTGESNDNHIFDYSKNNAGLDVGYRLSMHTKLQAGYEFLDINRHNRHDLESTTDHIFFLKLKNNSLDYMTAKLEYKYTARSAEFRDSSSLIGTPDALIERYLRRFDATDKSENKVKINLEIYPVDRFDFGLEYAYTNNDYDETILGRTEDQAHEFYLDFLWRLPQSMRLSGFAGYEMIEADSRHRQYTNGAAGDPNPFNGTTLPNEFNWLSEVDDDYWTYGLTFQTPLIAERVNLVVSWEYQNSDGETDLSREDGTALEDIAESDDYTKQLFDIKGIYAYSRNVDITLGYTFEKYEYEDLQYLMYAFQPNATDNYTGAYADHDYEANIGYLVLRYGF